MAKLCIHKRTHLLDCDVLVPYFGLDIVTQLGALLFISLSVILSLMIQTFLLVILESAVSERSLLKG